jgi:hypothetical protein
MPAYASCTGIRNDPLTEEQKLEISPDEKMRRSNKASRKTKWISQGGNLKEVASMFISFYPPSDIQY